MMDPEVLETLLEALETGLVDLPPEGPILVLNAQPGPWLTRLPKDRLILRTSLKPAHDQLAQAGYTLLPADSVSLPPAGLTLLLAPRQRDYMRALMARALLGAPEGGTVLACLPNRLGARTAERSLGELAGQTSSLSRRKCRAFWAVRTKAGLDSQLAQAFVDADMPRQIAPGLWSRPGLFSWDRPDPGSELLADTVPEHVRGTGADFGAGNGFLSRELLMHCDGIGRLDLYEADYRAMGCIEANLAGLEDRYTASWADVLGNDVPEAAYDFIVMNPPFHTGRADSPDLGKAFIRSAARALKPAGKLWMVANRHLPYEAEITSWFRTHQIIEEEDSYKIILAERPARKPRSLPRRVGRHD